MTGRHRSPYSRLWIVRTLGHDGQPWRRADIIAFISLVIAIASFGITAWMGILNRPHSELKVLASVAKGPKEVAAENRLGIVDRLSPAIDTTILNSGTTTGVILRAELDFSRATLLPRCKQFGGEVVESANYDVKIGVPKEIGIQNSVALPMPLRITHEMRFEVRGNTTDRFTLTIGPETIRELDSPWLYEFQLKLLDDTGRKLDLGKFAILTIGWRPLDGEPNVDELLKRGSLDEEWKTCLHKTVRILESATNSKANMNDSLLQQRDSLKSILGVNTSLPDSTGSRGNRTPRRP